jgi:glycosyltransferase involved in cell wall biosynthesis
MTFSLIIPVYNVADYLPKCLDSVLCQEAEGWEVILVDDGSTDGASGGICDRYAAQYPQRVRVIHQENQGLGGARNTGLEAAQGDYVLFVDSDDSLAPNALPVLSQAAQDGPDIITFGFVMDRDGVLGEQHLDALPEDRLFTLADTPTLLMASPNACNRLWKRSLFVDSGIRFPSRVWYEDIRTTTKLFALAKSIRYLPETFYRYAVREGSITRNPNVARNGEILDAFRDLLTWYQAQGLFDRYRWELCRLTVDHVYLAATVRVARMDPNHPLLGEFSAFLAEWFPDYRRDPYLKELPTLHRLLLPLIRGKHYHTIRLLFRIKDGAG